VSLIKAEGRRGLEMTQHTLEKLCGKKGMSPTASRPAKKRGETRKKQERMRDVNMMHGKEHAIIKKQ